MTSLMINIVMMCLLLNECQTEINYANNLTTYYTVQVELEWDNVKVGFHYFSLIDLAK